MVKHWREGRSPGNFIDLTGKQFGFLTVISRGPDRADSKGRKHPMWWTKCSCGNPELYLADGERLRIGHVKSCGCLRREGNPVDYTGKIINGYEVLGLEEIKDTPCGKKVKWWRCRDADGNETILPAYILTAGTGKPAPYRRKQNRYEFCGDHVVGYTEDGQSFIIDAEDYDKIKDYYWFVDKHNGYVETRINRKRLSLHRLILDAGDGNIIDHISHDKTDNRKVNLRVVTPMQNCINRKLRANNTSGRTGVYYHKGCNVRPWRASITVNKKVINLGSYEHFEDAVTARKDAEEKYFGEYSYANSVSSVPTVKNVQADEALFDVTVSIDVIDPVPEFEILPDLVPVP